MRLANILPEERAAAEKLPLSVPIYGKEWNSGYQRFGKYISEHTPR